MSLLDQLSSLCNNSNLIHHSNFFDFTQNDHIYEVDDKSRHRSMTTTPIKIKNIYKQSQNCDNQDDRISLLKNTIPHCATERKPSMHSQIDKKIRNLKKMSFLMSGKIRKIYYQFFIKLQKINNQKKTQKQNPFAQQKASQTKQQSQPFNDEITINTSKFIIQKNQEIQNFEIEKNLKKRQKYTIANLQKFIQSLSILYSKAIIQTNNKEQEQMDNKILLSYKKIKKYSTLKKFFQRIQCFYFVNCIKNAFGKISLRFKDSVKVDILVGSLKCITSKDVFQLKRIGFQNLRAFVKINKASTEKEKDKPSTFSLPKPLNPLLIDNKQLKCLTLKSVQENESQYYACQCQQKNSIHLTCNRFKAQNISHKLNRFLPCDQVNIVNDVPDNGHLLINQVRLKNYFGTHANDITCQDNGDDRSNKGDNNFLQLSNITNINMRIQKVNLNSNNCNGNNGSSPFQLQTIRKSLKITNSNNNMIKDIKKNGVSNKPRSSLSTQRKEWEPIDKKNQNEYPQNSQNQQNFVQIQKQYRTCTQGISKRKKNADNIVIDDKNYKNSKDTNQRKEDGSFYQSQKEGTHNNKKTYKNKNIIPVKFKVSSQTQTQIQLKKNTKTTEHKKILDKILAELNAQYLQKSGKKQTKQMDHIHNMNGNGSANKNQIQQGGSNNKNQAESKKKSSLKISLKESVNSSNKKRVNSNKDKNQISSIKKLQLQSHSKYSGSNTKSNQKDFFIELKLNKKQKIKQPQNQNSSAKKQLKEFKIQSNITKIQKFFIDQKPSVIEQNKLNKNATHRTQKCTRQSLKNKKNKALNVSLKNDFSSSFAAQQYGSTNFLPNFDDIEINFGQLQEINCSILKKPHPSQYQSQKPPSRQSVQYIESLLQTMRSNKHSEAEDFSTNYQFAYEPTKNQNSYSNITYFSNKPNNNTRTEMNSKKASMQSSKIELNNRAMKKKKYQNSELVNEEEGKKYIKGRYASATPPASTITTGIRLSMKRNSFNKQKEGWEDMFQKQKSKFLNLTKSAKQNQKRSIKCNQNEINSSKISKDSSANKIKPRKSFISTTSNLTNINDKQQSIVNSKVNLYKKKSILTTKNLNMQNN